MDATKESFSSLDACKGPPILMGDDSPVDITGKGRIELNHGSFEDVLHVPKLSVNLLSVYQITHSGTGKRVEFTPDAMNIFDIQSNSKIATGEVIIDLGFTHFMNSLNQMLPDYLSMLMIVVGYGIKDLVILILDRCSNSTSREWSLAFPTFIFQRILSRMFSWQTSSREV